MLSRARFFGLLALQAAVVSLGACDVDGVTPICPDADSCVTLPAVADAGAPVSDDAEGSPSDGGGDEGSAASP